MLHILCKISVSDFNIDSFFVKLIQKWLAIWKCKFKFKFWTANMLSGLVFAVNLHAARATSQAREEQSQLSFTSLKVIPFLMRSMRLKHAFETHKCKEIITCPSATVKSSVMFVKQQNNSKSKTIKESNLFWSGFSCVVSFLLFETRQLSIYNTKTDIPLRFCHCFPETVALVLFCVQPSALLANTHKVMKGN